MNLLIHIDGGSRGNPGPAGAGLVVANADTGQTLHEAGFYLGRMTNNVAEYHGLLRALDHVEPLKPQAVFIRSDSELMVRQLEGRYRVRNASLRPLYEQARKRLGRLHDWRIEHIKRANNSRADELANLAIDAGADVLGPDFAEPHVFENTGDGDHPDGPQAGSTPTSDPQAAPASQRSAQPPTSPAAPVPMWDAWLEEPAGRQCPAPPNAGARVQIGPKAPGQFCMFAAAAALNECIAQHTGHERKAGQTQCPLCAAKIRVEPQ